MAGAAEPVPSLVSRKAEDAGLLPRPAPIAEAPMPSPLLLGSISPDETKSKPINAAPAELAQPLLQIANGLGGFIISAFSGDLCMVKIPDAIAKEPVPPVKRKIFANDDRGEIQGRADDVVSTMVFPSTSTPLRFVSPVTVEVPEQAGLDALISGHYGSSLRASLRARGLEVAVLDTSPRALAFSDILKYADSENWVQLRDHIAQFSTDAGEFVFGPDGSVQTVIRKPRRWADKEPGLLADVKNAGSPAALRRALSALGKRELYFPASYFSSHAGDVIPGVIYSKARQARIEFAVFPEVQDDRMVLRGEQGVLEYTSKQATPFYLISRDGSRYPLTVRPQSIDGNTGYYLLLDGQSFTISDILSDPHVQGAFRIENPDGLEVCTTISLLRGQRINHQLAFSLEYPSAVAKARERISEAVPVDHSGLDAAARQLVHELGISVEPSQKLDPASFQPLAGIMAILRPDEQGLIQEAILSKGGSDLAHFKNCGPAKFLEETIVQTIEKRGNPLSASDRLHLHAAISEEIRTSADVPFLRERVMQEAR